MAVGRELPQSPDVFNLNVLALQAPLRVSGLIVSLSPRGEERLENFAAFSFLDAAIGFWYVMAAGLREQADTVLDGATLRVIGAEVEPADAGKRDGAGTHRAGFHGYVQIEAVEALTSQGGGGPQYEHLGVGGRIMARPPGVASAGDHLAAVRVDHDCADRHLTGERRRASLADCDVHWLTHVGACACARGSGTTCGGGPASRCAWVLGEEADAYWSFAGRIEERGRASYNTPAGLPRWSERLCRRVRSTPDAPDNELLVWAERV